MTLSSLFVEDRTILSIDILIDLIRNKLYENSIIYRIQIDQINKTQKILKIWTIINLNLQIFDYFQIL